MHKHPHFDVSMALAALLGTGNGMSQLRGQPKNTRNRNNKVQKTKKALLDRKARRQRNKDAKRTRAYNRKRR